MRRDRFLIVTADDFGLHESVNEAVEQAHRTGVLSATSLMVGAPASADAVRRAQEMPRLRIGLHLTLVDGAPTLAATEVPRLVDARGRFRDRPFVDGARYFLSPRARRELEAEIRAQFRAFAATGLRLDHVNGHKHFHVHPTLLQLLLHVGRDFGMRAVRWPYEPPPPGALGARAAAMALSPWLALMRHRLRRARLIHNDRLFGMRDSGAMDEARLLELLAALPPGLTEIYLHPATRSGAVIAPSMPTYRHGDELAALLSPRVRTMLEKSGIARGGYADWANWQPTREAA